MRIRSRTVYVKNGISPPRHDKIKQIKPSYTKTTPIKIWQLATVLNWKLWRGEDLRQTGSWLKNQLVELGPAFIKIGQFVSTRSDILPKELNAELKLLQDSIVPIPFAEIQSVLHEEYGNLYDSVFDHFEEEPIATASIGQVHRAVLKQGNKNVVVKIQKPYIGDQIRSDVKILKRICEVFANMGQARAVEFQNILQQYEDFLTGELDYIKEQEHMVQFRNLLQDITVVIPEPYTEFTTSRVLVMEDVPSTKVTDFVNSTDLLVGKTREQIADEVMDLFLYQIIMCGVVHCDPHPGNIGINEDGQIVLYDFGNVAYLGDNFRANVQQLVVAVYQKDVDEFLDILLQMKILQVQDPIEILEMKSFFVYLFEYLEEVDFQKLRASVLENDVIQQSKSRVKIDPQFISLFRVFSLLDGTCLALNPSFSYLPLLQPYFEDVFKDFEFIDYRIRRDVKKIASFPKMIQNTDNNILQMNKKMEQMNIHSQTVRTIMVLFVVLDNIDDPLKMAFLLPLAVIATKFF